jgi:hypothetical protein
MSLPERRSIMCRVTALKSKIRLDVDLLGTVPTRFVFFSTKARRPSVSTSVAACCMVSKYRSVVG